MLAIADGLQQTPTLAGCLVTPPAHQRAPHSVCVSWQWAGWFEKYRFFPGPNTRQGEMRSLLLEYCKLRVSQPGSDQGPCRAGWSNWQARGKEWPELRCEEAGQARPSLGNMSSCLGRGSSPKKQQEIRQTMLLHVQCYRGFKDQFEKCCLCVSFVFVCCSWDSGFQSHPCHYKLCDLGHVTVCRAGAWGGGSECLGSKWGDAAVTQVCTQENLWGQRLTDQLQGLTPWFHLGQW